MEVVTGTLARDGEYRKNPFCDTTTNSLNRVGLGLLLLVPGVLYGLSESPTWSCSEDGPLTVTSSWYSAVLHPADCCVLYICDGMGPSRGRMFLTMAKDKEMRHSSNSLTSDVAGGGVERDTYIKVLIIFRSSIRGCSVFFFLGKSRNRNVCPAGRRTAGLGWDDG